MRQCCNTLETASSRLGLLLVLRTVLLNQRSQTRYGRASIFESRVAASDEELSRGTHIPEARCCCQVTLKMPRCGLLQGTDTRLVHPRPHRKFSKDESKCSVGIYDTHLVKNKMPTYLTSLIASIIARVPAQPSSVQMWKRLGISCSSVKRSYLSLMMGQTGTSYSLHLRR